MTEPSRRHRLPWLLVALLVLLAALGGTWIWRHDTEEAIVETSRTSPPGRWNLAPRERLRPGAETDAEKRRELAATVSLPYAGGSRPALSRSGVTRFEPDRVEPGVNLVVSAHAPEVRLDDLEGRTLHRWRIPVEDAFPDSLGGANLEYVRRARLLPDGSLLALFQGGGIVKVDRDSELAWSRVAPVFNDLRVDAEGRILTLWKEPVPIDGADDGITEPSTPDVLLEDHVALLGADGELLARTSLLDAIERSRFRHLLSDRAATGDVLHSNTVRPLDGGLDSPLFASGNLLFSLREVSVIGVLSPAGEVVWAARGPWRRQHEPVPLPGGRILLFDNLGAVGPDGARHSRALEIGTDPLEVVWEFDGTDREGGSRLDAPLDSPQGGAVQRLANGNTLVVESERGRALEVTPGKEVVWEYRSPHRAGPSDQLVATLFDVVRIPRDRVPWLESR